MLKAPQGENPHGNAYLAADCSSCHAAKTHVDARGLELRAYTSQLALEEAGGNIILLNTEKQELKPWPPSQCARVFASLRVAVDRRSTVSAGPVQLSRKMEERVTLQVQQPNRLAAAADHG